MLLGSLFDEVKEI